MTGPPPIPTSLKLLRGNPGKRPLNQNEPQPGEFDENQEPPEILNVDGRAEWNRNIPILKQMRVLTQADYLALTNLCWAFQTCVRAQRDFAKAGILYKTESGYIQPSPLHSIIQQNLAVMHKIMQEFGMYPGSRSRISTAAPEKPKSKWDKLG